MASLVTIVDYGSGNLRSAAKALERAADELNQSMEIVVTDDPDLVSRADRIVVPGVGAFADCRGGLIAIEGMIDALEDAVTGRARPVLGICVGMQLMARIGHEHGRFEGFNWIDGEVRPFKTRDLGLPVPHMGWNTLKVSTPHHPVFTDLPHGPDGAHAYFVHSYYFEPADPADCLVTADYGGAFAAAVGRDTLVGTQFHPEKSQAVGLKVLKNFLTWSPL